MNELVKNLNEVLKDENNRYVYADTVTNAFVSAQIKALREERNLTQEKLAELIGTKQSGISRLQKADYSGWKVETLRKFAKAFGVRLRISFEEFGSLPRDIAGFTKERLAPRKFEDDPIFKDQANEEPEKAAPAKAQDGALYRFGTAKVDDDSWLGNSLEAANRVSAYAVMLNRALITESKFFPGRITLRELAGASSSSVGGAVNNPAFQPPSAKQIPDRYKGLYRVASGAMPLQEQVSEINTGAIPQAGGPESIDSIDINRRISLHSPRPRDIRSRKRA